MAIKLICAFSKDRVIGNGNALPWSLPADLQRFKNLTEGNSIVMGRKTFESIGRPLPNRRNMVMSRDKKLKISGVEVVFSAEKVLSFYKESNDKDLFVIGGSHIYKLFEPYCDNLMITYIDKSFEGDAFFPEIDWNNWIMFSEEKFYDESLESNFYFRDYKRS